jgi:hypothetical protein
MNARIDPERQALVEERLLELGTVFGIQEFMSGWFKGAPFEAIQRENMVDFIAYGFYCKRTEDLTPEVRWSCLKVSAFVACMLCSLQLDPLHQACVCLRTALPSDRSLATRVCRSGSMQWGTRGRWRPTLA